MNIIINYFNENIDIIAKLVLSGFLGGVIGYEREHLHRPAGLRTYMLVCIGSTLVVLTSLHVYDLYNGVSNFDPTRLSAQVISGIGFLGAGTILRDGLNVRGLTTAAGLWVVACIGLAVGMGFYTGAIIASIIAYIALSLPKKRDIENVQKRIKILAKNDPNIIIDVEKKLTDNKILFESIKYKNSDKNLVIVIKLYNKKDKKNLVQLLKQIDKITKVK